MSQDSGFLLCCVLFVCFSFLRQGRFLLVQAAHEHAVEPRLASKLLLASCLRCTGMSQRFYMLTCSLSSQAQITFAFPGILLKWDPTIFCHAFFYLADFWGRSILWHESVFHSFLLLNRILSHSYIIFYFIHLPVYEYSSSLHFGAIMNNEYTYRTFYEHM